MKKVIALWLILGSLVAITAAEIYAGADYIYSKNRFDTTANNASDSMNDNSSGYSIKVGLLFEEDWRLQMYTSQANYKEPMMDRDHTKINQFGLDLIKGFELFRYFSPFVQLGVGYAWMPVDGYEQSFIKGMSGKAGLGITSRLLDYLELEVGFAWQYMQWQNRDINQMTFKTSEDSSMLFAGFNIFF